MSVAATTHGDISPPLPRLSSSARSSASSSASSSAAAATAKTAAATAAAVARAVAAAGGTGGSPVFLPQQQQPPPPPLEVETAVQRRAGSLPPRAGDAWGGHHDTTGPVPAAEMGGGGSIGFDDSLNPWRECVSSQAFHVQRGGSAGAFQVEVGGGGLEAGSGRGEHPADGLGPRVAGR